MDQSIIDGYIDSVGNQRVLSFYTSTPSIKNYVIFSTPLPCGHSPSISLQKHPIMLRGTAGGEGDTLIRFLCCGYFLTPPSCGHLPYILLCKTQRRLILSCVLCLFFSLAVSRSITGSCGAIGETQRNGSDDERG